VEIIGKLEKSQKMMIPPLDTVWEYGRMCHVKSLTGVFPVKKSGIEKVCKLFQCLTT